MNVLNIQKVKLSVGILIFGLIASSHWLQNRSGYLHIDTGDGTKVVAVQVLLSIKYIAWC